MSKNTKRSKNILLPGLEEFESSMMGNFEHDPSLESELMAILGGSGMQNTPKSRSAPNKAKPMNIDNNLLNLDINEDEEDVGDIDEDDPELLAELNDMLDCDEPENTQTNKINGTSSSSQNVKTLENLKQLYELAIKDAELTKDTSKARRYDRSLKAINDLLRKANKGEPVNESEFPPAVYIKSKTVITTTPQEPKVTETPKVQAPSPPKRTAPLKIEEQMQGQVQPVKNNVLEALIQRQLEYKSAALKAKTNDLALAKGLMIVVKQFDQVIQEVKNGVVFDLENLPPPASQFKLSDLNMEQEEAEEEPVVVPSPPKVETSSSTTLGEELNIRREFYRESLEKAKTENNSGKIRRLTRVIQQYDEAIVSFGKKTAYNYEELLPPPGKSLISRVGTPAVGIPAVGAVPPMKPELSSKVQPVAVNKTIKYLQQKQAEFKAAALKAKNDGELPLAKELLRQSKGFDQMIQASESGLPVDLTKIPTLPTETDSEFEFVSKAELCDTPADMVTEDRGALFKRLQAVLTEQLATCRAYQQSVLKAGDVLGAKRFESLAVSCEKDLSGLRLLQQSGGTVPAFHFEFKSLSVRRANSDLGEEELAVEVVRGVDLAVPQGYSAEQLDTYIVLELPFPGDCHQTATSETVKHTNCPEYNWTSKFSVSPKSRVFQRVLRTKPLRADIYQKRGLLQRDRLMGSCSISMARLEHECTVHDCYDLHENRKVIGGKLEVKLRLRNGVGGTQTETVREKWLVIEQFNRGGGGAESEVQRVEDLGSIDVLRYEISEFRKRLAEAAGSSLTTALATTVKQKIREKEEAVKKQEALACSSDGAKRAAYLQYLSKMPQQYTVEAKKHLVAGNKDKAQSLMTKKKIVEQELERLKAKK